MRSLLLDRSLASVKSGMSLRRPQREALDELHKIWSALDAPLVELSPNAVKERVSDQEPMWTFGGDYPHATFDLATGVGKTRLMGAIMAYLYLSGEAQNFALFAPRRAILDKLRRETQASHPKYIFVDESLVPQPEVWTSENLDAFADSQDRLVTANGPTLYVLSPQAVTGDDRRFTRMNEFTGISALDHIRQMDDLIVFMDEAHHLGRVAEDDGAAAWTEGIRALEPRFQFGMTATVRAEPGRNVIYSYPLSQCLAEGKYTKSVNLMVRQRPQSAEMTDAEWDESALRFGLQRLAIKEQAFDALPDDSPVAGIKPVMMIAAADTKHADAVATWLLDKTEFTEDEVLVTHSKRHKQESDVSRLLTIEDPSNPVRVVVNVFELTEGWDVTNVYVIVPLRAMATYEGALQTMGRGLRLPAGRRVGEHEADALDVICFGRASLADIIGQATSDFGSLEDLESAVDVSEADPSTDSGPLHEVELIADPTVEMALPRVQATNPEVDLDFDIRKSARFRGRGAEVLDLSNLQVGATEEAVEYRRDVFITHATSKVLTRCRYLSEPLHREAVARLVEGVLSMVGQTGDVVALDWSLIAAGVAEEIEQRYRRLDATYEVVEPEGHVSVWDDATVKVAGEPTRVDLTSVEDWASKAHVRRPVRVQDWNKSVYDYSVFDSSGEVHAAAALDRTGVVDWWVRNDPYRFRVATPIGGYHPDLVARLTGHEVEFVLIEIKGSNLWQSPDSDARIKARATSQWTTAINGSGSPVVVEYLVVLDADAKAAGSLQALRDVAVGP